MFRGFAHDSIGSMMLTHITYVYMCVSLHMYMEYAFQS